MKKRYKITIPCDEVCLVDYLLKTGDVKKVVLKDEGGIKTEVTELTEVIFGIPPRKEKNKLLYRKKVQLLQLVQ